MTSPNGNQPPVGGSNSYYVTGPPAAIENAAASDSSKRKLIQQQLMILLHAHKCQQKENQLPAGATPRCSIPHCRMMKTVLNHMVMCKDGGSCSCITFLNFITVANCYDLGLTFFSFPLRIFQANYQSLERLYTKRLPRLCTH